MQDAPGRPVFGDSTPSTGTKLTRWLARPQSYRRLAGLAIGLILAATLASISAGGRSPLPPPLNLRGASPDTRTVDTSGLEFVPAPVIDLGPTTASSPSTTNVSSITTVVGSADSPDPDPSTSAASAASAETPDQPYEDDSADSPDDPDD